MKPPSTGDNQLSLFETVPIHCGCAPCLLNAP